MRSKVLLVLSLLVVATVCWGIWDRETRFRVGGSIYLPLTLGSASRAGMADLQWGLPRSIRAAILKDPRRQRGNLLFAIDGHGVGSVHRFARPGEKSKRRLLLLHYELREGQVALGSTAFYLPAASAAVLRRTAFGELIVTPSGDAVLVALCDVQRKRIELEEVED